MRIVAAGGADITITSPLQAAGADALTNSTSGIPTYDLVSGFNGTTWDRLRALGDDSDGIASASLGRLLALARLSGYNGATWDRLLSTGNNSDAVANTTLGNLQTLGFAHSYNGATWDRQRSTGNNSDAVANTTLGNLQTLGFAHGYNGATWDRVRTLGDTSLAGLGQMSVATALPGAGVVTGVITTIVSSATRVTMATPTSGKRIRLVSVSGGYVASSGRVQEIYFGTGAAITTNAASAIQYTYYTAESGPYFNQTWPDGAGPVGAVDEVLSCRQNNTDGNTGVYIAHYREE